MLDSNLIEPQVSNRLLQPLLARIEERHGAEVLGWILADAGLPEHYVRDPEKRVSISYMTRFRASVAKHLHGLVLTEAVPPMKAPLWQLWREAAQRSFEREMLGSIRTIIRAMSSPQQIYQRFPGLMEEANPGTIVKIIKNNSGMAVLSFACREGWGGEGPEVCWSRIGALEGVPTIWGMPLAKVEHLQCMHDHQNPGSSCLYRVHYRQRSILQVGVPMLYALMGAWAAWLLIEQPAALLPGALAGVGMEGWVRWWQGERTYKDDSAQLSRILAEVRAQYRTLWEDEQRLRSALLDKQRISPYLPPELLRLLDAEARLPTLGGEAREITVLFCDIASYSTISERLPPDEVLGLLNAFFTEMEEVIAAHQGAVLSYLGDGLMAAFGAPLPLSEHPTAAVRCALAMQERLAQLNVRWQTEGATARWKIDGIVARCGLHTGRVVAGNLGSQRRMAYSIIGDAVNVAARLEALNKPLKTTILISEQTWRQLSEALQAELPGQGAHQVKGRQQEVTVYGR